MRFRLKPQFYKDCFNGPLISINGLVDAYHQAGGVYDLSDQSRSFLSK
jgi:hypothetical protein